MYLLDTNTLIDFFRGRGRIAERLLATAPSEIGVSTVTLFEIELGLAKSRAPKKRREQLDALLTLIRLVPLGSAEARAAAKVRARLEKAGTPIGPFDTLIAGTAMAQKATLVTRNLKEFRRVRGLDAVSWY